MHARMEQDGLLSKADKQDLTVPYVCMVGTTTTRDPDRYPELKDDVAHMYHVIGNSTRYSVSLSLVGIDFLFFPWRSFVLAFVDVRVTNTN